MFVLGKEEPMIEALKDQSLSGIDKIFETLACLSFKLPIILVDNLNLLSGMFPFSHSNN